MLGPVLASSGFVNRSKHMTAITRYFIWIAFMASPVGCRTEETLSEVRAGFRS